MVGPIGRRSFLQLAGASLATVALGSRRVSAQGTPRLETIKLGGTDSDQFNNVTISGTRQEIDGSNYFVTPEKVHYPVDIEGNIDWSSPSLPGREFPQSHTATVGTTTLDTEFLPPFLLPNRVSDSEQNSYLTIKVKGQNLYTTYRVRLAQPTSNGHQDYTSFILDEHTTEGFIDNALNIYVDNQTGAIYQYGRSLPLPQNWYSHVAFSTLSENQQSEPLPLSPDSFMQELQDAPPAHQIRA